MGFRLHEPKWAVYCYLRKLQHNNSQNSLQFATIEWLRELLAARRGANIAAGAWWH
jgi:hypothetical protein